MLSPRSFSKDFLALSSFPLDKRRGGLSGQKIIDMENIAQGTQQMNANPYQELKVPKTYAKTTPKAIMNSKLFPVIIQKESC